MPATILVVDDDQTIRELLQLHLRNAGYAVHVAEDAVEAGHLVLRSPPDLIIADVNMPHMDGFEFIAAVRADNSLPYIPVIFLTSEEEGEIRGKELGADRLRDVADCAKLFRSEEHTSELQSLAYL